MVFGVQRKKPDWFIARPNGYQKMSSDTQSVITKTIVSDYYLNLK